MVNLTKCILEAGMNLSYFCTDCPRRCNAFRDERTAGGFCRCASLPKAVRAAPHFGEEPCISGTRGSGAVFFSGCNLRCVFCQNHEISRSYSGQTLDASALCDVMLALQDRNVHNINLVTPTHYTRVIAEALRKADLKIPVVWNSSGYESPETLRMLEGLVQIYMPDYKYAESGPARKYSGAADYPETAAEAVREMYRQRGPFRMDDDGMLLSGVLIRHLILPDQESNSMNVIDFVADSFPEGSVLFSLMSQYTPMQEAGGYPELRKTVSPETNEMLCHYMKTRRITAGFWQELSSATEEMIPLFDGTGLN